MLNNSVDNASKNLKNKTKNLAKANRVAKNGGDRRSKAKLPNQAYKEFSNAKDWALFANELTPWMNSSAGKGAGDLSQMGIKSTSTNVVQDETK